MRFLKQYFKQKSLVFWEKPSIECVMQKEWDKKTKRYRKRMLSYYRESHIAFPAPDGAVIKGSLCMPKGPPRGKILFLHEIEGNRNGGLNNLQKLAHRYAEMGHASLRIDFSGHRTRRNEWERYSPRSMLTDAIASLDYLDEKAPEIPDTIVVGASTGGSIAAMLGQMDERVRSLALLYPVLSYRDNFLAAAMPDEIPMPIEQWDLITPWRAQIFTEEKLRASLEDDKAIELYIHRYGPNFVKECKEIADIGDVHMFLSNGPRDIPTTILQGDNDPCVPHLLTDALYHARLKDRQVRLVTMKDMFHWVNKNWQPSVTKQLDKVVRGDFTPGKSTVALRTEPRYPDPNNTPQIPPKYRL
jgi:pimeloyl-ACP methyl ester carboxylesterase